MCQVRTRNATQSDATMSVGTTSVSVFDFQEERLLMGRIGLPEMLIILAIVIVVFGASRLPELGKGIGRAIRNFKDASKEEADRRD